MAFVHQLLNQGILHLLRSLGTIQVILRHLDRCLSQTSSSISWPLHASTSKLGACSMLPYSVDTTCPIPNHPLPINQGLTWMMKMMMEGLLMVGWWWHFGGSHSCKKAVHVIIFVSLSTHAWLIFRHIVPRLPCEVTALAGQLGTPELPELVWRFLF